MSATARPVLTAAMFVYATWRVTVYGHGTIRQPARSAAHQFYEPARTSILSAAAFSVGNILGRNRAGMVHATAAASGPTSSDGRPRAISHTSCTSHTSRASCDHDHFDHRNEVPVPALCGATVPRCRPAHVKLTDDDLRSTLLAKRRSPSGAAAASTSTTAPARPWCGRGPLPPGPAPPPAGHWLIPCPPPAGSPSVAEPAGGLVHAGAVHVCHVHHVLLRRHHAV